jgi:4-hydroxy-tetrahydrodipicolinate reductase
MAVDAEGEKGMKLRVCLAGATGWAGSALAKAIASADDMELVGAVSRTHAGKRLGDVLQVPRLGVAVCRSAAEALETDCDVFIEYTHPVVAKANVLIAISKGAHVVVGTSGLADKDYADIDRVAHAAGVGVLAVGNFALTAVLLHKFAEIAAKHIPYYEIIDYADHAKVDSPSGTARELAHRLAKIRKPVLEIPLEQVHGPTESRGANVSDVQVHSVRLPGYVIGVEAVFGLPDQRLTIRYEAGASAQPYVDGAMLAIRNVREVTGLRRGLDSVMPF